MNMSSLLPLAPRIFDLFDDNRDGTVDMREILCGFSSLRNSRGDDALRLCFLVRIQLQKYTIGTMQTYTTFLENIKVAESIT